MKHKKKGNTGRFLGILLAAVMVLSWLPTDVLSPAVHAEETGYSGAAGGTGAEKSASVEKNGNTVPPEESGTGEDDTEKPETEAGSTEEPESRVGSTEEPKSGAGSTDEPESGAGSTEEPGKEPVSAEKKDTAACVCGTLCTADSTNADCPVCGMKGFGIAGCKGEPEDVKNPESGDTENAKNPEPGDTENPEMENPGTENLEIKNPKSENTEQKDKEEEEISDTNLCAHHRLHTEDCGYTEGTQDKEGTPCTYECRICPIEDLISALPDEVTEDNAEEVRAQLDEILSLYKELTEEEQDQLDLSRCYELQEALDAASAPELLAGNVSASYRKAEWNGSGVVYSDAIENTCTAVTDSNTEVTWNTGWYVVNSSVTIDGRITVTGAVNLILADGCALTASQGITVSSGNSLTIYGQAGGTGKLTATGAADCAGIGGIESNGVRDSGAITICGGMVTAAGGECGAGIGGSRLGVGSDITIYGGTVEATGGARGAGIGGGFRSAGSGIKISGGRVTARGGEGDASGAGIGGGGGSGMTSGGAGSNIEISGGTVTATGGTDGAGIGGGYQNAGSAITISGGTVTAKGGHNGAGIGGGKGGDGNDITISGGEMTAKGGYAGAGIGGGYNSIGSGITISGGTVQATGGENGAGIGGGCYGAGNEITISGGGVTATGDSGGAGIGGGNTGASTGFFTGDDGSAVIFASSIGDTSDQDNWNGVIFQGSGGQMYGNVTLTENLEIPGGKALTIPAGSSLTIPDGKTLTIPAGASVTNEGGLTIAGGELTGGGTLAGGGTFFTENLMADMISVPTGLYYTPDLTEAKLAAMVSISRSKTILGKTFTVDLNAWILSVTKVSDLKYTATYINTRDPNKTISKVITLLQSGTKFVGSGGDNRRDNNGDSRGGNTAPGIPVTTPEVDTNPGTEPVKPETGNTERPGTGAVPDSGSAEETRLGKGIPFIKGEDGKIGWDVIRTEEERAEEGSIINVDMNGSTVVPGDIFDRIKGKDITITFDMGGGIVWSVDGKSVTTDKAGDIDFSVKTGTNAVPVDIVNNVTGERYSIQISLAYDGEFGFTAVLCINLGKENAGYTASLYYYNGSTGELEFICSDEVAEDGTVSLAFTHASDYVIAIDGDKEEESDSVTEPAQPSSAGTDESTGNIPESPETGQAGRLWWIIAAVLLVAAVGTGMVLTVKKKGKDKNSGQ